MTNDDIRNRQITYFDSYFQQHGATVEGLNYGSKERQQLCFAQAAKIIRHAPDEAFSLNDYGCGYADFFPFLEGHGYSKINYTGYDITPSILSAAREQHSARPNATFVDTEAHLPIADYTVAVGVFNIHHGDLSAWTGYVTERIDWLWSRSRYGLAFNILTKYSDADKMRDYLYYADPLYYFDHCKRTLSRNVALLHDYGVYEFTILVRAN